MRSSSSRFAIAIIAGLFIMAGCTAAPTSAPDLTATGSPMVATNPATASRSAPASPSPSATSTLAPAPPKPTGVTFVEQVRASDDGLVLAITQTVTWASPCGEGVEVRVYGVTECIAEPPNPSPGTSGPCLVAHTSLPASIRTLLARAPASDGTASWMWTQEGEDCDFSNPAYDLNGPVYHAVVLAAYGASDHSIFVIAAPGGWWRPALGDIVC